MITTIIICITVVILAIIATICYYLRLKDLEDERLSKMPSEEPKDNRVYLDRLQILKTRYEQIVMLDFEDDEDIPQEIHDLLKLIEAITNRLY